MSNTVLELKHIVKKFPGVIALNDVSFDLIKSEVHALVGENGSGKSTLMNIVSGVLKPDEGEIYLYGKKVNLRDPKDAQDKGISMIHQELSLSPSLSVMENIFIGRHIRNKAGFINAKEMRKKCDEILKEYHIENVKNSELVKNLSVSQMQLIEIAKAIYLNNKIIIMDEPSSALTKAETQTLFRHIEILKKNQCSVIFISHRLDEVKQIADRVTVLRDGELIVTKKNEDIELKEIISSMVGKEFENTQKRANCANDEKVLEVKKLSNKKIHDISFYLKKGEVLGITGLVGSGRTELLQTIFGDMGYDTGEIYLNGEPIKIDSVNTAIKNGIGLIPEGRKTQGLFPGLSVQENISIVKRRELNTFGFIDFKKVAIETEGAKDKLRIKTPTMRNLINYLSGGNQQKAIIARWLINNPRILLLDEPSHGIDVGAKAEIYDIIDQLSKQGVSIVLVSSELPEILTVCDRIIVMYQGRINGEMINERLTQEEIMACAMNQG